MDWVLRYTILLVAWVTHRSDVAGRKLVQIPLASHSHSSSHFCTIFMAGALLSATWGNVGVISVSQAAVFWEISCFVWALNSYVGQHPRKLYHFYCRCKNSDRNDEHSLRTLERNGAVAITPALCLRPKGRGMGLVFKKGSTQFLQSRSSCLAVALRR